MHAQKFLKYYMIGSGTIGFYRGWIADYQHNGYSKKHELVLYSLVTHRFMWKTFRGIANMCLYATVGHPEAFYRFLCRVEISLTNKDPYQHMYAYNELFDFTTLPPKIKT
jgi:hypothetical protein